jgi:hypothetical protein
MNYRQFNIQLNVLKLLLFSIATSFVCYGQEVPDDQEIDLLLDELFFNDEKLVDDLMNALNEYDFIYSTVTYNSNTFFAGRDSGVDQLNITPQVSYFSSSGFNAAVTSVYFEKQNPNWDFIGLTVGYGNTIGKNKNVHYNLGYSRLFFSDGFDDFNNSIDLTFGIRNKNRTVGFLASASYLFGTEQSVQLSGRFYGNLTLTRGLGYALRFRPQVNFLFAEQSILFFPRPRPMLPPSPPEIIEEFGLLNTQFSFPVSYTTSSWDFELAWNLNLPSPIEREGTLDSTNFFSFTIGYLFDLSSR